MTFPACGLSNLTVLADWAFSELKSIALEKNLVSVICFRPVEFTPYFPSEQQRGIYDETLGFRLMAAFDLESGVRLLRFDFRTVKGDTLAFCVNFEDDEDPSPLIVEGLRDVVVDALARHSAPAVTA